MGNIYDLIILFFSSFVAATIFPAQSEIILASLLLSDAHATYILLIIATLGNVLGSLVNWFLGRYFVKFQDQKWFPIKTSQIDKYSKIYRRVGLWSLLFAWVPFVGDPITVIAGMSRVNVWLFLLLVTIGKAGRYLVITLLF